MERNFNVDRRFRLFADKLTSNHASKDLIIESSYNTIELSSNAVIFDGIVDLSIVTCNNINISNISEIVTKFLRVKTLTLPSNVVISYNSVNDGYIINTRVGYNLEGIGRSDAYFTYINVSGGDSSFNDSLYINKNLLVDGTLTINNDLLINGTKFEIIENSFNNYKASLEQNFYSTKILTKDLSALNITISNELVVNKTAFINNLTLSGQLLNNVLRVPNIFTIDPSGFDNHSGTLIINGDLTVLGTETTFSSSIVEISDAAITLASKLANRLDLINANAGLDISNIASLKYNGTTWDFSGGQLTVDNKKILFADDISLAKRNFDLSLNTLKTDFSSSFFILKRNIDNSFNDTYNRTQIDSSFILKSAFDVSLIYLNTYVDNSYVSKNQSDISFRAITTLMDISYIAKNSVITGQPQYDYSTSTISQFGQDIFGEETNTYSGYNVSLSEDGTIIGITAPYNNGTGTLQGSARIYKYNDVSWVQLGQDIDGEANNDVQAIIKLSKDGTIAALGSWFNSGIGSIRVFKYNDISWIQQGQDIDGTAADDEFGRSISLSANGKIIAIGATHNDTSYYSAGQVLVYSYNDVSWNIIGTFNGFYEEAYTGFSVSLSSSGTILAISTLPSETSPFFPRVDVYELSNNAWSPKGPIIYGPYASNDSGSRYGRIIELSSDGTIVAINDRFMQNTNYGRVLVYKYTSSDNSWNRLGSDISGPVVTSNEDLDPYIALSADGTIIALGYVSDSDFKGLVRLYKFINNNWIQIGTTDLSGDNVQDNFGYSIALSSNGSILAIGSIFNPPDNIGRVRTYNVNYAYTVSYLNSTIISNSFDISFASFNTKVDLSYVLKTVFEASHNSLKNRFEISFNTIKTSNFEASSIIIDTINTRHSSQRFANTLWNQLGLDISNIGTFGVANKNNKIVISNDGKVAAYSKPYTSFTTAEVETAVSTWIYRTVPATTNLCRGVCWSPELGLFVAVGDSGNNRVMTSPNGITWTARTEASVNRWYSVCWSKELGIFVAVSRDIQVMTSIDGITWISRTPASGAGRSVCWSPELGLFVAVADDGAARSSNGITWIASVSVPQGEWVGVCWSPEVRLFVAVSINFAKLMTSSDGITWTVGTSATATSGQWASVCWSPQLLLFVAVGFASTKVMTSPDGTVWTGRAVTTGLTGGTENWMSVCWSKELGIFVAVGNLYGINNRVMTSRDGTTWTARAGGGTDWWYGVCWSGELGIFAAVGSGGTNIVMTSSVASTTYNGIVYVYELSNNNWNQLGTNAILGISGDELGYSLALSSNGRIVAASSLYNNASSGQVRLFELSNNTNTWIQKGLNINGPRAASESGYSISLAGNGNRIAIGAWKDNSNGSNAGAVRVYDFSASINDWRQQGQTIAGVSGSFEGYATALSLDGQTLASASILEASRNIIGSGGTITINKIDTASSYIIHSFTTVGTTPFIVTSPVSIDYIVVAGGGSGGCGRGGGGGAGGVRLGTMTLSAGSYNITVGAGGTSVISNNAGNNGGSSSISTLVVATGGGGGGGWNATSGRNGGSGGGSSAGTTLTGGTGISGEGFAGSARLNTITGGGGGGAGSAASGKDGAIGITSNITGTIRYYAGGGGAGAEGITMQHGTAFGGIYAVANGTYGGGNGASTTGTKQPFQDAVANTGGGGGGHEGGTATGAGGSGIVIIRYLHSDNTTGPVKTFTWSGTSWINKGTIEGPQIYLGTISATSRVTDALTPHLTDPIDTAINFDGTIIANPKTFIGTQRNASIIQVWKYINNSWTGLVSPSPSAMTYYPELSYDGTICAYSGGEKKGTTEWDLLEGTGFVEVRRYNNTTFVWDQIFKRMEPNWARHERSTLSKDGNVLVITNIWRVADGTENNIGYINVYKYVSDMNWTPMGQTLSGTATITNFATGVALSHTGDFMVCSTRMYSSYRGIARIYRFNTPVANNWNLIGEITGPVAGKSFGWIRAGMSSNGEIISIGSFGTIYVYKYISDMSWIQLGAIRGPNIYDDHYYYPTLSSDGTVVGLGQGGSVQTTGDIGILGNRTIQIYKYVNSEWILIYNKLVLRDILGFSLSGNGKSFFAVYRYRDPIVHTITNTTYQTTPYIENLLYSTNKTKYFNLFFGRDIKLSSNGNKILIGATGPINNAYVDPLYSYYRYNQGSIYVYEYIGTTWRQLGQSIHGISGDDEFGSSVSMSNDGTIISAGSNNNVTNSGYVRVYTFYNNNWYQVSNAIDGKPTTSSVGTHALSGDGRTLIQTNNIYNSVYGINKDLALISPTATISTTISGDLAIIGRTYLKSFRISDKHIFDVSINGYSSNYLASSDVSASIVDYYSNVDATYNRVFKIDACGNISNYSGVYGSISDIRLKENIVTCAPKLEHLLKVRVVNYNLKNYDTTKYIGVLAQELEELFPELVLEDDTVERFKSVNYSSLTIMLIKALQEQQVLINNLIATLEELEEEIENKKLINS